MTTDAKKPPDPVPNATVLTPTGREARVLRVDAQLREADIQWTTGDRAGFKFVHLREREK